MSIGMFVDSYIWLFILHWFLLVGNGKGIKHFVRTVTATFVIIDYSDRVIGQFPTPPFPGDHVRNMCYV